MRTTVSFRICLIALSVACFFSVPEVGQSQVYIVPRRSLGAFYLGQNLGNAANAYIDAAQTARAANAEMTAQIIAARRKFWDAWERYHATDPENPEFAAASKEFAEQLWNKDLGLMLLGVTEGPYGPRTKFVEMMMGKVDGGIPKSAVRYYNKWMIAIREELGARNHTGNQPDMVMFSPANVKPILTATAEHYDRYKIFRDWAEYLAAGKTVPDFYGTWDNFLFSNVKYFGRTSGTGYAVLSDDETAKLVTQLIEVAGQDKVRKVCEKMMTYEYESPLFLQNPLRSKGGAEYSRTSDAFDWLLSQELTGKAQIIATFAVWEPGMSWEKAVADYASYQERFGEAAIQKAFAEVNQIVADRDPFSVYRYENDSFNVPRLFDRIINPAGYQQQMANEASERDQRMQAMAVEVQELKEKIAASEAQLATLNDPNRVGSAGYIEKRQNEIAQESAELRTKIQEAYAEKSKVQRETFSNYRRGPGRPEVTAPAEDSSADLLEKIQKSIEAMNLRMQELNKELSSLRTSAMNAQRETALLEASLKLDKMNLEMKEKILSQPAQGQ